MKSLIIIVLLLVTSKALAGCPHNCSDPCLWGKVTSELTGQPVEHVEVQINPILCGKVKATIGSAKTNNNGIWHFYLNIQSNRRYIATPVMADCFFKPDKAIIEKVPMEDQ